MLPEFRGKGLMRGALKKVIDYAFKGVNVKLITAFPSDVNDSSVGLLEALNFRLEDKIYNGNLSLEKILIFCIIYELISSALAYTIKCPAPLMITSGWQYLAGSVMSLSP